MVNIIKPIFNNLTSRRHCGQVIISIAVQGGGAGENQNFSGIDNEVFGKDKFN